MSSLQVDNIQTYNSNPPVIKNVSGTEVGTFCRAWVNFNGTGVVAIRQSFNVSSITDNGTGQFVVNFSTAMPDANYSVVGSAGSATSAASDNAFAHLHIKNNTSTALQSGSVAVHTGYQDGNVTDYPVNTVAIFR